MSYFDDQFDAWMDNDCRGTIEDTDLGDVPNNCSVPMGCYTKHDERGCPINCPCKACHPRAKRGKPC